MEREKPDMNHKKNKIVTIITVIFFCICGIGVLIGMLYQENREQTSRYTLIEQEREETGELPSAASQEPSKESENLEVTKAAQQEIQKSEEILIYVHVCGAVAEEGVYKLPEGSRGVDALEAAGGFLSEAATAYCNLAQVLTDGMRLYIPTKEEAATGLIEEADKQEQGSAGLVNINRADKETLMTLPGIGESKAESIVTYRSRIGSFQTLEELMNVSGIGQAVFEALRDKITL